VFCQVDYAESVGMEDQDQIRSAHWTKKYVSIFAAYASSGGSRSEGQPFGLVSNFIKHDKYSVIMCLEMLISKIAASMPDGSRIIFFSNDASSQFKNRFVINRLTRMTDPTDIDLSWN
jgi:hypothetical protein